MKKKKSAIPAAPKPSHEVKDEEKEGGSTNRMADVLCRTDMGKCKSFLTTSYALSYFAHLCTLFLCYFHNIVASAIRSSYLSIEARENKRNRGRDVFDLFSNFEWTRSNDHLCEPRQTSTTRERRKGLWNDVSKAKYRFKTDGKQVP